MNKQIIMRPCYNRPEMFALSLEYEIQAREYFDIGSELRTVFVVEYNSPKIILDLIDKYPYTKAVIQRESNYGLSKNILEGMRDCFDSTDDYVIYIEDDILLHKTYFMYIHEVLNMPELSNYSVISSDGMNDNGPVNVVKKAQGYAALAPVISKKFYRDFIEPCSTDKFYTSPMNFVLALNDKYKEFQKDKTYRYTNAAHRQQAGVINRLTDAANIEQGMYVVRPFVTRMQHIGIYGHNRRMGTDLSGKTFEDRLNHLRKIILDKDLMYQMAGSKEYNDYKIFSPSLDTWDGTLELRS